MSSVISAQGLVKAFGPHRAVDGIDLDVAAGQVFGFLGPNGAGKSTTIRLCPGPDGFRLSGQRDERDRQIGFHRRGRLRRPRSATAATWSTTARWR
jgi:polyether ionophore transport system ATP-binding protein